MTDKPCERCVIVPTPNGRCICQDTTPPLAYAWSCLQCPDSGAGPKSDLAARKHEQATNHATTTHLDRPEWTDPVRVGEVLPDVVAAMVRRECESRECALWTRVNGAETWENGSGPSRGVDAPQPGPRPAHSLKGRANRGL